MQKVNRIVKTVVAVLLSLVLITTCLVSGIFAKYVKKGNADFSIKLKEWGVTITPHTDIGKLDEDGTIGDCTFEVDKDGETVTVHAVANSNSSDFTPIAPGTSGCLACLQVTGAPEAPYKIDFSGDVTIGEGFKQAALDAKGDPMAYFPIIIYVVAYDVTKVDGKDVFTPTTATNLNGDVMDFAFSHRRETGGVEHALIGTRLNNSDSVCGVYDPCDIGKLLSGDYAGEGYPDYNLDNIFDSVNATSTAVNRVYSVQWCWPYNDDSNYYRKADAIGDYQTRELDAQLGENVKNNREAFQIEVDLSATVFQLNEEPVINNIESSEITLDTGATFTFGTYPQEDVTTSMGATLNNIAGDHGSWTSYNYTNGSKEPIVMSYTDVEVGGEKYRGVYFEEYRNDDHDDNSIKEQNLWFKYTPIEWTVLNISDSGKEAFLLCNSAIDAQAYNEWSNTTSSGDKYYNKSNPTAKANSYAYSTIRKWLNETFFDTAFSELQKQIIRITHVEVSIIGGAADKNDVDTYDKVFLLSKEEVEDHVGITISAEKTPTAYAKSQGVYLDDGYVDYLLRTSDSGYGDLVFNFMSNEGEMALDGTFYTYYGIVPALWIKL